jgi:cation:H+ antiporter
MTYILIIAGFALLLFGGEAVVRGAVGLAQRLGISPLIVGLTVVGFGTSLPEMVVSVNAALVGAPGIAIGNVIGSNIANMMLILGSAALIMPIAVNPSAVKRDTICMVGATLVFFGIGVSGLMVWWHGIILLTVLTGYISFTIWHDNQTHDAAAELHREEAEEFGLLPHRIPNILAVTALGLLMVIIGAEWLVRGATELATDFGVPEEVIGLTVVAIGTSLPELATSVVAAYRGHADVCVGNVLGSNIFNLFGITSVTALFADLPFSDQIVDFDLWALALATAILVPFMVTGLRLNRMEGGVLFVLYCCYVAAQFLGVSGRVAV